MSVCRCECVYVSVEARGCSLAAIYLVFYETHVLPVLDLGKEASWLATVGFPALRSHHLADFYIALLL